MLSYMPNGVFVVVGVYSKIYGVILVLLLQCLHMYSCYICTNVRMITEGIASSIDAYLFDYKAATLNSLVR